jgi:hypothetical protein
MKQARMVFFILFSASFGLLCGCFNRRGLEGKIITEIQSRCKNGSICSLRISELTDFEWDKMYAFRSATNVDVDQATGTKLHPYADLENLLVFTYQGKVVFQESEPIDVEHVVKDEVVFDIPESAHYKVYGHDVVFSARVLSSSYGPYYELTEVGSHK